MIRSIQIHSCKVFNGIMYNILSRNTYLFYEVTHYVNLYLTKSSSCRKIPVSINSVDWIVTVFEAFARNFFALAISSSREMITAFCGHDGGGRTNGLPPHELIIPVKVID